jgi:predicted nucleic acid-binding protein
MRVFVDTSAILALVDESDQEHALSEQRLLHLISTQAQMIMSNYVVVEACAVLQRRVGMRAVRMFRDDLLPLLTVVWVTERQHEASLMSLIRSDRRKLSMVDCVSLR